MTLHSRNSTILLRNMFSYFLLRQLYAVSQYTMQFNLQSQFFIVTWWRLTCVRVTQPIKSMTLWTTTILLPFFLRYFTLSVVTLDLLLPGQVWIVWALAEILSNRKYQTPKICKFKLSTQATVQRMLSYHSRFEISVWTWQLCTCSTLGELEE